MKNWMMEMEENTVSAIQNDAKNENEVLAYVKTNMNVVDKNYVRALYKEFSDPYYGP
jgi:hypothetical protein